MIKISQEYEGPIGNTRITLIEIERGCYELLSRDLKSGNYSRPVRYLNLIKSLEAFIKRCKNEEDSGSQVSE